MVNRKIDDEEAFKFWVSLGDTRSLAKVAKEFHIRRRGIQKCSIRNQWSKRLAAIDAAARKRADELLIETRAEIQARHLRMLKAVATRGIQALQKQELETAMEGVKAIEAAIKLERVIHGEATANVTVSVAEQTRREVELFLRAEDGDDELNDDDLLEEGDDLNDDEP